MDGPRTYFGKVINIFLKFENTESEFVLSFSSNLNETADNESWGITNLEISGVIYQ